jgi:6-phosphogluconolactonase
VQETPGALADAVASAVAHAVSDAVARRGRCSLLLSGGSTPRAAYELLASRYRERVPWLDVQLFWGDERFVPLTDPRSNYRMAREALVEWVPCPPANVHPIPTNLPSPEAAAQRYEELLRAHFAEDHPAFDLVLLGLGDDAHTASIFPGSPALEEPARWVMAVDAPVEPRQRITMTMRVLTTAAQLFVVVSGAGKAAALRRAIDPASDPARHPAAALQAAGERVVWWAARDAAADSAV